MSMSPLPSLTPLARRLCLLLAAAVSAQLFYLGAQPLAVGLFHEPWDKLAHGIVYGGIAALLWLGFGGRHPIWVIGIPTLIGAADEWHQRYLPGRSADFNDFLADAIAAIAVCLLLRTLGARPQRDETCAGS